MKNIFRDMTTCSTCGWDFVHPVEWAEVYDDWEVLLRCGNCAHEQKGIYSQDECEAFDESLDNQTDTLMIGMRKLTQANMQEYNERFINALKHDAITPEDF